jgi:opacity protein-like surface antigen
MKQTLAGAFLFASLLATGATGAGAADIDMGPVVEPTPAEWYLAISGGLNKIFDVDFDADDTAPTGGPGELDFDYGFRGAAAIGMRFGNNFRAELEFAGSSTDGDSFHLDGDGGGNLHGSLDIFSLLAKVDYEMEFFGWWHPYIGIGAGGAHVTADELGPPGNNFPIDGSDTVFAAAIEGGSMFELSENVELFTQTQLMFLTDVDLEFDNDPSDVTLDNPLVLSSSVGLRLKF